MYGGLVKGILGSSEFLRYVLQFIDDVNWGSGVKHFQRVSIDLKGTLLVRERLSFYRRTWLHSVRTCSNDLAWRLTQVSRVLQPDQTLNGAHY
jgi:hypothetical protein